MLNLKWIPQSLYNIILGYVPIVCVDVILPVDDKFLLVQRGTEPAKNEWWLVGGRLHKMEDPKRAVCRKVIEELGVPCDCGKYIITKDTKFLTGPNEIAVHSVNLIYEAFIKWDVEDIILGDNELNYGLFYGDELNLSVYVRECISKYKEMR